jgi:hypothetical protein
MSESKVVLRFTLSLVDDPALTLPIGAKVLHIAEQKGQLRIWVEMSVADLRVVHTRRLLVLSTGDPVPDTAIHLGTAICSDGELMWHVYEVRR